MATTVVNIKTGAPYDVNIMRASSRGSYNGLFGNPFPEYRYGRDQCLRMYADWVVKQPQIMNNLHLIRGKRLACVCKPLPCHGDILANLADR